MNKKWVSIEVQMIDSLRTLIISWLKYLRNFWIIFELLFFKVSIFAIFNRESYPFNISGKIDIIFIIYSRLFIGEIRVNEQLVLTCMHTLLAREHNRLAKALTIVNPHWDDEILFQEARRIVIAEIQHITYNEFLPILLGKDVMEKFGLLLEKEVSWTSDTETKYEYLYIN